jgi:hypothetical protein
MTQRLHWAIGIILMRADFVYSKNKGLMIGVRRGMDQVAIKSDLYRNNKTS